VAQRVPGGDPVRVRAVARRSAALAAQLRGCVAVLVSAAEPGCWHGPAQRGLAERLRSHAPGLGVTAQRYQDYAAALFGYAGALEETGPRLRALRRGLEQGRAECEHQRRQHRLTGPAWSAAGVPAPGLPAALPAPWSPGVWVAAQPQPSPADPADPGAQLLVLARQFQATYDRWADALDCCVQALTAADTTDPTRDLHGFGALAHRVEHTAATVVSPFQDAIEHPSLHTLSTCLASLTTDLSVLGIGLLFICPPAGMACLTAATITAAVQLGLDTTRRAHGEHLPTSTLALDLAAAIPLGGTAVRGLRTAETITHLVPGGGLLAHEGLHGGHTLTKHVGQTVDYLRDRLAAKPDLRAASTFYNREVAENSIAALLGANAPMMVAWLASGEQDLTISGRAARPTGIVLRRFATDPTAGSGVKVVLRRSSSLKEGFRIHTAMVTP